MIIYIHGFGSSGEASKAKMLRAYCQENKIRFIAPSLPTIPDLAIKTLSELIESYQDNEPVHLMGSSLGGYYSLYLSDKYNLKYPNRGTVIQFITFVLVDIFLC